MVKLRGAEVYPFYYGATPEILKRASELRKNMTPAEKKLWNELRFEKIGVKFRRQHPIADCIVDFFCYEARLIIEVDGSVHDDSYQSERDEGRTQFFKDLGLKVIRFRNEEIFENVSDVIKKLKKEL